jgi:phosphohistidine phosphatase SixA
MRGTNKASHTDIADPRIVPLAAATAMLACAALFSAAPASAQQLAGAALVDALRHGGYVMVMRHAHAPEAPPSAAEADPANRNRERQLDAAGQAAARGMGSALRALHLPIGVAWSSPTYRARETARLAGLSAPRIAAELSDGGTSMRAATNDQADWLRKLANRRPRGGTDSVIVTQYPNIKAAFGDDATNMGDGEAIVLRPGKNGPRVVGRIAMDQWPQLTVQ